MRIAAVIRTSAKQSSQDRRATRNAGAPYPAAHRPERRPALRAQERVHALARNAVCRADREDVAFILEDDLAPRCEAVQAAPLERTNAEPQRTTEPMGNTLHRHDVIE